MSADSRPAAAAAKTTLASVTPTPGVPKPDPIFVSDDITRTFGGLQAVKVAHAEVQREA